MNTFIENLNQWGSDFLRFAWPMLWQASLLIVILFSLDYLGRRHLRASVRYTLWLVVLVKLCLPPTLALPTSPVWWLHKTAPAIAPVVTRDYSVTYDQEAPAETHMKATPDLTRRPPMAAGAWLLVASITVSMVLLLWLLVRWGQVTRRVRRAVPSERLSRLSSETQTMAGMNFSIQARVTVGSMSPAVCGLFRPAVLIPQSLVDTFSDEQLRAVLLHELIHLRRRDVWVNFFQALVQIVYWWHPLVWVANARIRSVREEAVDDAVVLTLRDEAENYAPTLLEVAKLALRRPRVSLGLVGIMESRQALRRRIERLLDAHTPRRTGLTLVSLLGILAFTAVAVPMGAAPTAAPDVAAASEPHRQAVLITAEFYALPKSNGPQAFRSRTITYDIEKQTMVGTFGAGERHAFEAQFKTSGLQPFCRPRIETCDGAKSSFFTSQGTNGLRFTCYPRVTTDGIKLSFSAEITGVMDSPESMSGLKVSDDVLTQNKGGIYLYTLPESAAESHLMLVIGVQLVTNGPPANQESAAISQALESYRVANLMAQKPLRPQLHIEARFLEVPAGTWDSFEKFPIMTTNGDDAAVALLTSQQQTAQWQRLWRDVHAYCYAEPEVTTTSERQTQMRATTLLNVITNATYEREPDGSNSLVEAMEAVEIGPTFDVVPKVLADGYTIDLKASPLLTEFLGYDRPAVDGNPPKMTSNFQIRQASAHVRLWDGQTVVFGKFKKHIIYSAGKETAAKPEYFDSDGKLMPPAKPDTEMLVLVTATIVDPAGNRVHSDDQMAFARNGFPPQTGD